MLVEHPNEDKQDAQTEVVVGVLDIRRKWNTLEVGVALEAMNCHCSHCWEHDKCASPVVQEPEEAEVDVVVVEQPEETVVAAAGFVRPFDFGQQPRDLDGDDSKHNSQQ